MVLRRAARQRHGLCLLIGAFFLAAMASSARASDPAKPLPTFLTKADAAPPFAVTAERAPDGVLRLNWSVAPGTYLYRERMSAVLDGRALPLDLPVGEIKDDPVFGSVEIYHHDVAARLPGLPASGRLHLTFQGCSQEGICFPPEARTLVLDSLAIGPGPAEDVLAETPTAEVAPPEPQSAPAGAGFAEGGSDLFAAGLGWSMLAFLGFGLLLSVTPCVFPMIPILAGMLARSGEALTPRRGLVLTGTYILAMAAAYGLVGAVAGWSGANLQAALQTPLALGLAAGVFVALALSMFGLFDLALPAGLAARLAGRSGRGTLGGAAVLGFGSALIVGPCVTPPLAGAMLYAASTGDALAGAATLFMLGLGMGLPLLLVGLFGPALLPRGGAWLARAKHLFGIVFLAVAIVLAGRLLLPAATLALLGVLLIGSAVFLGGFDPLTAASGAAARLTRGAGIAAAIYGAALIVGASAGAEDPLRPLAFLRTPAAAASAAHGIRVTSSAAFDEVLAREAHAGPVLVDFTADWCAICKANALVLAEPELQGRLSSLPRITADVTKVDAATRALMQRFQVVGPPTIFLVDKTGRELSGSRIVGPVTIEDMARRLNAAGA